MTTRQRTLGGRYEVDAPIGRGGMAQVYRGTDLVLGRAVAVKILDGRLAGDEAFLRRFRREARSAARLNHPGVVSVYDTGSDGDAHFIVMELVPGRTLSDIIASSGPLEPKRAATIAAAVAEALSAAHAQGLVHRDVKPGNVMVADDGTVKVMDFGIARATSSDTLTRTAAVLGTANYLSPEQAAGDEVDARSDIYSLGVVLYEMLTGRVPFTADTPVGVAYKHVNEEPTPPSGFGVAVPPALETVAMRALAKSRDDRYPSADAMRRDLERFVRDEPAHPDGAVAAGETAVAASGAARAGAVEGVPAHVPSKVPSRAGRGTWTRTVWPALAVIVAALLLATLLPALLRSEEPNRGAGGRDGPQGTPNAPSQPQQTTPGSSPATSPAATSTPTPSASATSTRTPSPSAIPTASPTTIEEAVAALEAVALEGISTLEIDEKAADQITKEVDEALREFEHGDLEEALQRIEDAHERVGEAVSEGLLTSEERADALHRGLDDLASLMQAAFEEGGNGHEGDGGGGEGRGDGD